MVMGVSSELTDNARQTFKFTILIESRDVIEDEIYNHIKTIKK